jgi:hypothetical protein
MSTPVDHSSARKCLNEGVDLALERRYEEALALFRQALQLWPEYPEAHHNIALSYTEQARFEKSIVHYREAIRLRPDYFDPHYNLSHVLLLRGDFEEGWREYEWRWWRPGIQPYSYTVPYWDGRPLGGATILLHCEQGLGDAIQFLRYGHLVRARGGIIAFGCPPALAPLASTCAGLDHIFPWGATGIAHVHAPLLSLPRIFGTTLATIPAQVPYLAAPADLAAWWGRQLAGERKYRVGIVWQGNSQHVRDHQRSIPLAKFARLVDVPGVALYSLQVGEGIEQLAGSGLPITDLGSRFDPASLTDLAGVLVNLDLLVGVDTAPVHLAGALGVPVWVLLATVPDWRWLLDTSDSPWYPTARLFRQRETGNWSNVFEEVAQALREQVAQRDS